jgi:type IV pilus assembly protein PilQ
MTNIFIKQVKNFRANVGVLSAALCVLLVQPAWAENILKDVKASNLANGDTAITLQFAQPIGDIKAFNTDSPPRIALDLPETNNAFAQKKLLLSSGLAKSVNTYESAGRTRVLVDLNGSVQYHTKAVGNTLVLTLDKQPAVAKAVDVSSVDFKRTGQGAGQLVVKFGSEGAIASMRENGSQIIVDLPNANVADALIQNLEVAQKATPVVSVSTKRLLGKTQLILTTKGNAQALAYQTGNEYVLEISPAAVQLSLIHI